MAGPDVKPNDGEPLSRVVEALRTWRLADALGDAVYERSGDDLRNGLYVALDPWSSSLFDLTLED